MGHAWYEQREKSLRRMRYASYVDYLDSKCWRAIRNRILKRCNGICEVCRVASANQVHHRSYSLETMRGKRPDFLVACCRECHETAEFDGNRKTKPKEANMRMGKAARESGHVLPGICNVCKKNPTGKRLRQTVCRACRRQARLEVELACLP